MRKYFITTSFGAFRPGEPVAYKFLNKHVAAVFENNSRELHLQEGSAKVVEITKGFFPEEGNVYHVEVTLREFPEHTYEFDVSWVSVDA